MSDYTNMFILMRMTNGHMLTIDRFIYVCFVRNGLLLEIVPQTLFLLVAVADKEMNDVFALLEQFKQKLRV